MISVCMATYNGEHYIKEQIYSILSELGTGDELVVVDDCSNDGTADVIGEIRDERVFFFQNDVNLGYIRNFEKAISLSRGDVILLSDQDDLWPKGRVGTILRALEDSGKAIIAANMSLFESDEGSLRDFHVNLDARFNRHGLFNLVKMLKGGIPYFGCCMAFKREILPFYLPFPHASVSHDVWLGIIGNVHGLIYHIEDIVTFRRIHEANVTRSDRSLLAKIKTRIIWLGYMFKAYYSK